MKLKFKWPRSQPKAQLPDGKYRIVLYRAPGEHKHQHVWMRTEPLAVRDDYVLLRHLRSEFDQPYTSSRISIEKKFNAERVAASISPKMIRTPLPPEDKKLQEIKLAAKRKSAGIYKRARMPLQIHHKGPQLTIGWNQHYLGQWKTDIYMWTHDPVSVYRVLRNHRKQLESERVRALDSAIFM